MTLRPLTDHNLEFLSLIGGCVGLSESKLVKLPHCWKSHVTANMFVNSIAYFENSQNFYSSCIEVLVLASRRVDFSSPVSIDLRV